jgi:hypothetical protein
VGLALRANLPAPETPWVNKRQVRAIVNEADVLLNLLRIKVTALHR